MGRNARGRADREVAKAIAGTMPEVELITHHGTLEMRVGNRTFARFPADGKSVHVRAGKSWSEIPIEQLDRDSLQQLMVNAWIATAPDSLNKIYADRLQRWLS